MKTLKPLLLFVVLAAYVWSCQKEKSFENGGTPVPSDGSLQGAGGACLGTTVGGTYKKDTTLTSAHYVDVSVIVNVPGSYTIGTDTINGMYFRATGTFTTAGTATVRLPGVGKPIAVGTNTFTVTYDSTSCTFPITTIGTGGGSGSAVFTLDGSPNICDAFNLQGAYNVGVACTNSNTVLLKVNVTTPGLYTLNATPATVTGFVFQGSGTLAAGPQTIQLTAQGTPTIAGTFNYSVTAGTTTCSFPVTIGGGSASAIFTLVGAGGACGNFTQQGTYTTGVALNPATNTVTLQVNVTTPGTYSVTTTASGITFSSSGTFTNTGIQPLVLSGAGTTSASGQIPFSITAGATTCSFNLTVQGIDYFPRTTNSNWSYEFDDDDQDSLIRKVIPQTINALGNTYNIFMEDFGLGFDSSGYYRKSGNNYYEYFDIGSFFGLDQEVWGEYIMLTDNVNAGTTWNSAAFAGTVSGIPVQVRVKLTIVARDATLSLTTSTGTVSYPNTTSVREDLEFFDGVQWQTIPDAYLISYYSKNVGLVKAELYDATNTVQAQQEMRRSQVF